MFITKPLNMKSHLALLLLCLTTGSVWGQISYTLRIQNTQKKPLKNVVVTAENNSQNVTLTATTDATGSASFTLTEPGVYKFSYLEIKDVSSIEVKEGFSGNSSRSVTYDPKGIFAEKPKADRSGITFRTMDGKQLKGQANMCKLIVLVKDRAKNLVPNVPIAIVSIRGKVKFTGKSNAQGLAIFYVPIGQNYEIDVDNLPGFKAISVPNFDGLEMTEVVFFEKLKVKETTKGDTIIQGPIAQKNGTSTHVLFSLQLDDFDGQPLSNEPVYLNAMKSKRVYQGKTNEKGACSFMVIKGDDYTVDLKYETGIHLVEAPTAKSFSNSYSARRYRGSALIEQMLAEQKAEMERMLAQQKAEAERTQEEARLEALRPKPGDKSYTITYRETPVKEAPTPLNYLTKTAEGFNVDFKSSGPSATPTVIGNKMFTQQGMYSPNYYCLNATNGSFVWGMELGETGISPAVYHNGIILINTYSCTLYAIDAATGKLLWSKWLAGMVYSTPTADGNSVFVVYNHGGYPVIVSFDLKSGELNWMQRVDSEAIACPVVEGSEVHVASQSGIYYVFDKDSGKSIITSNTFAIVSSPTVTEDKIYITASFDGSERLIVLDRKTLKLDKKYPVSMNSLSILENPGGGSTHQMNFNGSHPIVYQNKVVVITDSQRIRAFDMSSEKLLWQKVIATNPDQLPIIANGKVVITSSSGDIISYDIMTGTPKLIKKIDGEIEGQPIAKNGLIYIATSGIIMVVKTIHHYEWNQWNKDASHNTYWKE